jgi:hypothetical protein
MLNFRWLYELPDGFGWEDGFGIPCFSFFLNAFGLHSFAQNSCREFTGVNCLPQFGFLQIRSQNTCLCLIFSIWSLTTCAMPVVSASMDIPVNADNAFRRQSILL